MASTFSLVFSNADGTTPVDTTSKRLTALNFRNWFHKRAGGHSRGSDTLACRTGAVAATAVITVGTSVDADDTVTIGGVAFTAKASGATGNQWNLDADATVCATALVASINASTTAGIAGCVTASNVAGVVTITAAQPGKIGNAITIATSDATDLAITGGATRLAGGDETLTTHTY